MHDQALTFVSRSLARFDGRALPVRRSVVELGSRQTSGPKVRDLFGDVSYIGVDAQPGAGVDVVANAATWQPDEPVDLVVCCEMFEHTPRWSDVVANVPAMLADGGAAIFTCAGPGRPVHGVGSDDPDQPGWYANVSPDELRTSMRSAGFKWIEATGGASYSGTDTYAIGWRA